MRILVLALALAAFAAGAQEKKAPPKKKPAATRQQKAHAKATPEQIRRFNELEKKKAQ